MFQPADAQEGVAPWHDIESLWSDGFQNAAVLRISQTLEAQDKRLTEVEERPCGVEDGVAREADGEVAGMVWCKDCAADCRVPDMTASDWEGPCGSFIPKPSGDPERPLVDGKAVDLESLPNSITGLCLVCPKCSLGLCISFDNTHYWKSCDSCGWQSMQHEFTTPQHFHTQTLNLQGETDGR
jgi:hypothetical protein